jgi:hypothetical protein
MDTRSWPVHQYVQARLDDLGYDADAVFSRLPIITGGSVSGVEEDRNRKQRQG